MSKLIKEMQLNSLRTTFAGVRDMVFLSIKGLDCQGDSLLRANLRKKKIRVQILKNSLARKVFSEMGLNLKSDSPVWAGPTALAWGANSIAELSREIESELKAPKTAALFKEKVVAKGALADGQEVTFEQAIKMPTRADAIAKVAGMILSPAGRLLSQLRAPGGNVAGQIKQVGEKKPEGETAEAS